MIGYIYLTTLSTFLFYLIFKVSRMDEDLESLKTQQSHDYYKFLDVERKLANAESELNALQRQKGL